MFGILVAAVAACGGCRVTPRSNAAVPLPTSLPGTEGLCDPYFEQSVDALVAPPESWEPQPLKKSALHTHQIWVSPTSRTAYGVIHFRLPFPVGYDPVLWYFMREMRRTQGKAELLAKQWDPNQRMMRFVAEGGRYAIRTNLSLRGLGGWIVYAATLRNESVDPDELDLAERAREHTIVGVDSSSSDRGTETAWARSGS